MAEADQTASHLPSVEKTADEKQAKKPRLRKFAEFPENPVPLEEAESFYLNYVHDKHGGRRAHARRAVCAARKGGRCFHEGCTKQIEDFRNMTAWQFDHVHPLETTPVSPDSNIKQFYISGNQIARRSWEKVQKHARCDTVLMCSKHHLERTQATTATAREIVQRHMTFADIARTYSSNSTNQ